MYFKIVHNSEIHLYKKPLVTIQELRNYIIKNFKGVTDRFELTYQDLEGDSIVIDTQEDLQVLADDNPKQIKITVTSLPSIHITTTKDNLEVPEKIVSEVHEGVSCNGCNKSPLIGIRYKCVQCQDFDFCQDCEGKAYHDQTHTFVKLNNRIIEAIEVYLEEQEAEILWDCTYLQSQCFNQSYSIELPSNKPIQEFIRGCCHIKLPKKYTSQRIFLAQLFRSTPIIISLFQCKNLSPGPFKGLTQNTNNSDYRIGQFIQIDNTQKQSGIQKNNSEIQNEIGGSQVPNVEHINFVQVRMEEPIRQEQLAFFQREQYNENAQVQSVLQEKLEINDQVMIKDKCQQLAVIMQCSEDQVKEYVKIFRHLPIEDILEIVKVQTQ